MFFRCLLALGLVSCLGAQTPRFVWWEGEAASATNFPERSWLNDSFGGKRDRVLSAGAWLANDGKRRGPEAFARYEVRVPKSGRYAFWTRKFWKHGPFRWRFGQSNWRTCGRDIGLADSESLGTHVGANWVHLGEVELKQGSTHFELRLLAGEGEKLTAAFDCFLLIDGPFTPRGRLKPGEKSGKAEEGFWAFEPDSDDFRESPIDLRHLNEKSAGEKGRVARKGAGFVRGDGKALRFWGVNAGPEILRQNEESQRYLARRLAKCGVNVVRIHGNYDASGRDPLGAIDPKLVDGLHRFVALLKNEGIYSTLSFYFPLWVRLSADSGWPGYDNAHPYALLFFDERLQERYRKRMHALLTTKNPYTKLSLAEDPALALVELQNEDSLLFWTFGKKSVPEPAMTKLERRFGRWLIDRHGSLDKALQAWGGAGRSQDRPDEGRMELAGVWNLTGRGHGEGAQRKRMSDQLRFFVELQRDFYQGMATSLKKECSYPGLCLYGNWHTADPRVLGPLERYSYAPGDVIDRHGYFGGKHEGEGASYSVRVGQRYEDRSALYTPWEAPLRVPQVVDRPHVYSEIGWSNPNRYKAEFPFLLAAYGSLQGIDGFFQFALGGCDWDGSVRKFPFNVPSIMGQSCGLALLYRRGDLKEGRGVFHERLGLEELFDFQGAEAGTPPSLDALRKKDARGAEAQRRSDDFHPASFFAGPVTWEFAPKGTRRKSSPRLASLIDSAKGRVASETGELDWDWRKGVVTIDSPRAQGVCGFLGRHGPIELKSCVIDVKSEYAAILVISLDDRPIARSKRILVQCSTDERSYGWKVEGGVIRDLGSGPLNVRRLQGSVRLKRHGGVRSAVTLDANGQPRGDARPLRSGGRTPIPLPEDALYLLLR